MNNNKKFGTYMPPQLIALIFFYKQPFYNELALRSQIAKQISGLNLFSLSNNKLYRLKKSGVFSL